MRNNKIGMRYCCEPTQYGVIEDFISRFLEVIGLAIKFYTFIVVMPIAITYILIRIGRKRTIRLFKRFDREEKRRKDWWMGKQGV